MAKSAVNDTRWIYLDCLKQQNNMGDGKAFHKNYDKRHAGAAIAVEHIWSSFPPLYN